MYIYFTKNELGNDDKLGCKFMNHVNKLRRGRFQTKKSSDENIL